MPAIVAHAARRLRGLVRESITTSHHDPVHRVYGSILAQITFTLGVVVPIFFIAQSVFGVMMITVTEALTIALSVTVIWYVNRRGSILAPVTVIVLIAVMMIAIYDPASYVEVNGRPVVNVAFAVPGLLASLLMSALLGYPVMLATVLLLGMRAIYAGYPPVAAQHFVIVALSELSVVISFVAIVSFYFRAALMHAVSTAEQLEQRVLERTAELDEVHRSWQIETAQVTHDLKNLMTEKTRRKPPSL